MRLIFLFIVIANLLVVGWWSYGYYYGIDSTIVSPVAVPPSTGAARLRLLQELPADERHAIPVPAETLAIDTVAESTNRQQGQEVGAETEAHCYRVNGIVRKEDRDALAAKIAAQSFSVLDRGESFLERTVYWVHIPPMKNYVAASSVATALSKARVRDFFLVRSGDAKNGISLGLFTMKEGAEKRQEEISSLQLKAPRPEIKERTSTIRSYWLTAKSEGDGGVVLEKIFEDAKWPATGMKCPP